jgi:PAS domain S-box-containing protein
VLLDALKVAVIVTDLAGTVVECNRQAETLYGVSRESLLGLSGASFAVDELSPDVMATIGRTLSENKTWEGDFAIRRRSGEIVMVHAIDSAVLDDAGRLCAEHRQRRARRTPLLHRCCASSTESVGATMRARLRSRSWVATRQPWESLVSAAHRRSPEPT